MATRKIRQRSGRKGGLETVSRYGPSNMRARAHKGGVTSMANRTPEERSELGRRAVNKRWEAVRTKRALAETDEPPLDDDLVI